MRNKKNRVAVALGSNLGPRSKLLRTACRLMTERCGSITCISRFHETAPEGGVATKPFLNGVAVCETDLSPPEFLRELNKIESELGRQRTLRWGNRTIDLDIIFWKDSAGNQVAVKTEALEIPHPRCHERAFVMEPFKEVAREF